MRTRTLVLAAAVAVLAAGVYANRDRLGELARDEAAHDGLAHNALAYVELGVQKLGLDRLLSDAKPVPPAAAAPFVMPVPVAAVVKRSIPIGLDYAARTESIRAISLQAKISAYVTEQAVQDGEDVKAGQLLYRLDPRDFQVALDQANAATERDTALLDYQRQNYNRGDQLSNSGWLAKDSLDQRASTMRQTEASLTADRAATRAAQLNLDYSAIHAPFAGRIGRNQAPVGTLVTQAGTVLNTLVQLNPVYVTFSPSETDLAAIQAARQTGRVTVEASVPGQTVPDHKGEVTFVDNTVERTTGTVTARAVIANPDETLLPGQYVRLRVHLRDQPDTLLVPQVAVGSSQLGKYVYVLGAGNTVEQRPITLGPNEGPLVAVATGLKDTDQVITGNLQKIGPGMPVKPLPEEAAPKS